MFPNYFLERDLGEVRETSLNRGPPIRLRLRPGSRLRTGLLTPTLTESKTDGGTNGAHKETDDTGHTENAKYQHPGIGRIVTEVGPGSVVRLEEVDGHDNAGYAEIGQNQCGDDEAPHKEAQTTDFFLFFCHSVSHHKELLEWFDNLPDSLAADWEERHITGA